MKNAQVADAVRAQLDAVIHQSPAAQIPEAVKAVLIDSLKCGALALPSEYCEPVEGSYARRLLHRDPSGDYTIVVMTWGPGQRTALHDHAGIWCVECVVDGNMEVSQFDLTSEEGERFRFEQRNSVIAGRGTAGCLIPPFEYHVLANAQEKPSVTLHVYGGEMDHCHVFEPQTDGSYRRVRKDLSYT